MLHVSFAKHFLIFRDFCSDSCTFFFLPDYPYCLTGKELRGVIKGLIGRCSDVLPDFFDHCVSSMLREMDRQSGMYKNLHKRLKVVWISSSLLFCCHHFHTVLLLFWFTSCSALLCSPWNVSVLWRDISVNECSYYNLPFTQLGFIAWILN